MNIFKKKIKKEELVYLLTQLHLLLESKVTLSEAILMISSDLSKYSSSNVLFNHLYKHVSAGHTLTQAFYSSSYNEDSLLLFLLDIGEKNDSLCEMIALYCDIYDKQNNFYHKIKNILFYPIILIVVTFLVIAILMFFVLPKFIDMFSEIDVQLPFITMTLVEISIFLQTYYKQALLAMLLLTLVISFLYKYTKLKQIFVRLYLCLPYTGALIRMQYLVQISSIISLLLYKEVPLLSAIQSIKYSQPNTYLRGIFSEVELKLKAGEKLSHAIDKYPFFPELFKQMVRRGESVHSLAKNLSTLAILYSKRLDQKSKKFLLILEPLVISIISIIIGVIIVAIYLPIFQIGLVIN